MKQDPTAIARTLALAEVLGDERAAIASGVAAPTLRAWRHKHGQRPAVQALVAAELRGLAASWRPALANLARAAAGELADRIEGRSTRTEPASRELVGLVRALAEGLTGADALLGDPGDDGPAPTGSVQ